MNHLFHCECQKSGAKSITVLLYTKKLISSSISGKNKRRGEVRHSALKRKDALEEYSRILINLDPRISQHEVVINFFEQNESDRTPAVDARSILTFTDCCCFYIIIIKL